MTDTRRPLVIYIDHLLTYEQADTMNRAIKAKTDYPTILVQCAEGSAAILARFDDIEAKLDALAGMRTHA